MGQGFSNKMYLVRRRGPQGQWVPTKTGIPFFRYMRDEHVIEVSSLKISRENAAGIAILLPHLPWFSTPYLKTPAAGLAYRALTTEAERSNFVEEAALTYLRALPTTEVNGVTYHILANDSIPIVWDERYPIVENRQRTTMSHDIGDGPPTTEVILNRTLLGGYVVPDGCWRPFNLHPNALKDLQEVCCVVQMIHDSYQISKAPSGSASRRGHARRSYSYGATVQEIEAEFDVIFNELGYKRNTPSNTLGEKTAQTPIWCFDMRRDTNSKILSTTRD
jgi:hypothetical protein